MAAATESTEPIPPTRTDTLYSVAAALEEHPPEDVERIIRALAAFYGVDLVQVVEERDR